MLKSEDRVICEMSNNKNMLGFYSVKSGMEIHVIDTDPFSLSRGGGLTDTSLVEKYRMSDEKYNQRSGTMREYIKQQRMKDPNFSLAAKKAPHANTNEPPPGEDTVAGVSVGARCEVRPGSRRGTVKFVGELPEITAGGFWVMILACNNR